MIKFVKCAEDLTLEEMQERLKSSGVKVLKKYKLTGVFKVDVPNLMGAKAQTKESFQSLMYGAGATVTDLYDDFPVKALLNTAVPLVHADRVWKERGNLGEGIMIGICDTGLDRAHPDFQGRIVATEDFTGEGDSDGNGHGTHVASIAAGDGAGSNGRYRGAAPAAKLAMAKGLDSRGSGSASSIADGIEWLVDQRVHLISLSLGGTAQAGRKDILQVTCEAAVERGIPVFCAAGNEGPEHGTIATPGISPRVITVGAVDDRIRLAPFSSRGPTVNGDPKPDLVAPGVDVIAARAVNTQLGPIVESRYVESSGTSMATPLVAGIGALLLKENPRLNSDQLKARLMRFALPLEAYDRNMVGGGKIDAWAAMTERPPAGEEEGHPDSLFRRLLEALKDCRAKHF